MGVPRFVLGLLRHAPSKTQLLRSLALGSKGGDRTITSADGTSLAARRSGGGPPVILVHGTLDGIGSFSLAELQLAEHYGVWVYDRRGRGGSTDSDEYSLDREVDDLRAVMEATGAAPHVVGHSYGAVIAMKARSAGGEMRSLVLYEPPMNGDAVPVDQITAIRTAVEKGRADDAIAMMARGLAGVSDEELAIAMSVPPVRKHLRDGVRTAPRELEAIRSCSWDDLPLTDVPTLVLRGERNSSAAYPTAEQSTGIATDVEIQTLAGQGHLAQTFAPAAFVETLRDFLDRH